MAKIETLYTKGIWTAALSSIAIEWTYIFVRKPQGQQQKNAHTQCVLADISPSVAVAFKYYWNVQRPQNSYMYLTFTQIQVSFCALLSLVIYFFYFSVRTHLQSCQYLHLITKIKWTCQGIRNRNEVHMPTYRCNMAVHKRGLLSYIERYKHDWKI